MPAPQRKRHPAKQRATTLADVGRVAGVSAMAASAVLNGARTSSRISEETRARILAAAAQLNYRPNAAARALVNRRMHTIGVAAVIVQGELNHYFLEVFNGILAAAARYEQNITVFGMHDWGRDTARIPSICDGRIDGLILVAPTFTPDKKVLPAHTPFVSLHANSHLPGVVNIESDEERGAYEMVRLFLAKGHRRIMHIAGPEGLVGAERRLRGYREALAAGRVTLDEELVVPGGYTVDGARSAMRQWLRQHAGELLPQAILCANDSAAVGCMEALAELGIRAPDDVSLAGFDDTLMARTVVPQLASIRQPLGQMGGRAVELLLACIEPDAAPPTEKNIVFPVELVPRASVGSPPAKDKTVPVIRRI